MCAEEVDLIYKWANDPDVLPFWYGRKKTRKKIKEDWNLDYFTDKDPYSGRCFAILLEESPIGMINHNKIDMDNRNTTIDVLIGEKKYWNKGFGTDALRTFVKYLFEKFELNRIWLGTYAFNDRAVKAYRKAGFKQEGIFREDAYIDGKYVDTIIFAVLRKEFKY